MSDKIDVYQQRKAECNEKKEKGEKSLYKKQEKKLKLSKLWNMFWRTNRKAIHKEKKTEYQKIGAGERERPGE